MSQAGQRDSDGTPGRPNSAVLAARSSSALASEYSQEPVTASAVAVELIDAQVALMSAAEAPADGGRHAARSTAPRAGRSQAAEVAAPGESVRSEIPTKIRPMTDLFQDEEGYPTPCAYGHPRSFRVDYVNLGGTWQETWRRGPSCWDLRCPAHAQYLQSEQPGQG